MKQTSKQAVERRSADRRAPGTENVARAAGGERRVVENRGVGEAMVDALEDILQWERASERALRVAQESDATASESISS